MPIEGRTLKRLMVSLFTGLTVVVIGTTQSLSRQAPDDLPTSGSTKDGTQTTGVRKTRLKLMIKAELEIESQTIPSRESVPASKEPVKVSLPLGWTPRTTRPLRLGIVDGYEGQLATREVFFEDIDNQAVMQGDIVVGKTDQLNENLKKEIGKLASRIADQDDGKSLSEQDRQAIESLQVSSRDVPQSGRPDQDPKVLELARSVALIPDEVLNALKLDSGVLLAINTLRDMPQVKDLRSKNGSRRPLSERLKKQLQDQAFRNRLKASLGAIASRANVGGSKGVDAPKDNVSISVDAIQKLAPETGTSSELDRLRALASLASADSLGFTEDQKKHLKVLGEKAPASARQLTGSPYLVPGNPEDAARSLYNPLYNLRWPTRGGRAIVPYKIDPTAQGLTSNIQEAIKDYADRTVIMFQPWSNESDFVTFKVTGFNLSPIGRRGGEQIIQLVSNAQVGSIIHEMGHAIGLWHEQCRPDRDDHVKILWENVEPKIDRGVDVNRSQFAMTGTEGQTYGDYDPSSVMHYGSYAFSKQLDVLPTIVDKETGLPLKAAAAGLNNTRLSDLDIKTGIEVIYGKRH